MSAVRKKWKFSLHRKSLVSHSGFDSITISWWRSGVSLPHFQWGKQPHLVHFHTSKVCFHSILLPSRFMFFCLLYFCISFGIFRQVLMCDEKTSIYLTVMDFYMWCPFCLKDFGGGEFSVYWGRIGTSFTACPEIREGEGWFWALKCLGVPLPLGAMLSFSTHLLCFYLPSTQRSQGSQGITRNRHFVPRVFKGIRIKRGPCSFRSMVLLLSGLILLNN